MQPPHFPFMGKNIMPTGSAPALGGQLSCCLAVKPFLTVTGSTKDLELGQGRKGGGGNPRGPLWDLGQVLSLHAACRGPALISHAHLLFRPLMTLPLGDTINSPWQSRKRKPRLRTGPTPMA